MSEGPVITEQDRAEAACVSARGSGHQFELQLGHLCNNRCVFCSSGQLTEMRIARTIAIDPMLEALEKAKAEGARRVTFLGGEPTLHKGFPDAVKRAVELDFEEIIIFTNGVMLPHPGFVDRIVALGDFEWRISIQGGNEAAHVAVTKRKDSFSRIIQGLELLKSHGQSITANMCVNEHSYRSLPDYVDLVEKYGLKQLHVDIVRPASTGERSLEYLQEIMPRYSAMAPYMDRMMSGFEQRLPGFDVNLGNLPFCILPQWAHRIQHGGEQTITQSAGAEALELSVDKYEWHASTRRLLERCQSCVFSSRCTGIFATYLDIYGDEEFQPVSREQLLQGNSDGRHFVTLNAPLFSKLKAQTEENLPEGWALELWRQDDYQLTFDLQFRHQDGELVVLSFQHPFDSAGNILSRGEGMTDVGHRHLPESEEQSLSALETVKQARESMAGGSRSVSGGARISDSREQVANPPSAPRSLPILGQNSRANRQPRRNFAPKHASPAPARGRQSTGPEGLPVILAETVEGRLKLGLDSPLEPLTELLSWLAEGLEAQFARETLLSLHQKQSIEKRLQERTRALALRMAALGKVGEWKVIGREDSGSRSFVRFSRPSDATRGEASFPEGVGIEVVLAPRMEAGRLRIGVDARLGRDASPDDARSLVSAIQTLLQG